MNKKAFIGVTLITATVVGGAVYFRHKIMATIDQWLDEADKPEADNVFHEAINLLNSMTDEEAAEFEAALKQNHPSS